MAADEPPRKKGRAAAPHRNIETQIHQEMDDVFDYKEVLELPPECATFRQDTAALLHETRVARDMSDDEINDVLDFFNGDKKDHANLIHDCVRR